MKIILQEIIGKKNNTWNLSCLVAESFVPVIQRTKETVVFDNSLFTANQQTSILYCRLSDFIWKAGAWESQKKLNGLGVHWSIEF